jgi:hypothetical protein
MAVTFNSADIRVKMLALARDYDELARLAEGLEDEERKTDGRFRHFAFSLDNRGDGDETETDRSRAQEDHAQVAGGQRHEVRYESMKTGRSAKAVKRAVKRVGNSRKKVGRRPAK